MNATDSPTIHKITRHAGIAGQVEYDAVVQYEGEERSLVVFIGSEIYGGPVVMVTGAGQTFVTEPGRFGSFGRTWVERFFASA